MVLVGHMMISLNDEKEKKLRGLAKELHGGRKGAISEVVSEALEAFSAEKKRMEAVNRQIALMEKGFDLGIRNGKAYEKRSDLYDQPD